MSGYVRIDECGNRARREGYSTVLKAARKSQGRVSNGLALGSPWPPRTTVGMNGPCLVALTHARACTLFLQHAGGADYDQCLENQPAIEAVIQH
jgi:hypothetical protein